MKQRDSQGAPGLPCMQTSLAAACRNKCPPHTSLLSSEKENQCLGIHSKRIEMFKKKMLPPLLQEKQNFFPKITKIKEVRSHKERTSGMQRVGEVCTANRSKKAPSRRSVGLSRARANTLGPGQAPEGVLGPPLKCALTPLSQVKTGHQQEQDFQSFLNKS